MSKFIDYIFPLKLHLTILQLEDYKFFRFLKWISRNYSRRRVPTKKSLVITSKIKAIIFLSFGWFAVIVVLSYLFAGATFSIFTIVFLITQFYLLFGLALLTLKPYESVNKVITIERTRKKIIGLGKLTVIGITGSFGKTSTKEILYQILKDSYKTLRTPESYNTVFGIAKVVDYELDESYDYFICEMAAYKRGDIKELSHMVPPDLGIITGIAPQHLERFGSIQNIVKTKFELADAMDNPEKLSFNLDDERINEELDKRRITARYGYGTSELVPVSASKIAFTKNGSSFLLSINNTKFKVTTKLFGLSNIKNILAATSIAAKIGLDPELIVQRIESLTPFANRFEIKNFGSVAILDNTFSSNLQSFLETIRTAKQLRGKKALVTPGIVELGKETRQIHEVLAKASDGVFDKIILVGKNTRTESFYEAFKDKDSIDFISDNRDDYFNAIEKLKDSYDWIFLENDVTQNY